MKEYKILEIKYGEAEEKMNEMSRQGWRVISADMYVGGAALTKAGTLMIITFEKEVENKKAPY